MHVEHRQSFTITKLPTQLIYVWVGGFRSHTPLAWKSSVTASLLHEDLCRKALPLIETCTGNKMYTKYTHIMCFNV